MTEEIITVIFQGITAIDCILYIKESVSVSVCLSVCAFVCLKPKIWTNFPIFSYNNNIIDGGLMCNPPSVTN